MSNSKNSSGTNAGDEVMKAIGVLANSTNDLKEQTSKNSGFTGDEAVGILTIVGRALLAIFGK